MMRSILDRVPLRVGEALFAALVLAHLYPIWGFDFFPSQDGPAHLANAVALQQYLLDEGSVFHQYYRLNPDPYANWPAHLLLAALQLVLPALVAEKLLLSAYAVGLALCMRYALGGVSASARWAAFFAFPLVYSFPCHMGFYNFVLSLPLFLLALGFWLRRDGLFTGREAVALALGGGGLYLAHSISFGMAWIAMGSLALWRSGQEIWTDASGGRESRWRNARRRVIATAAASIPGAALMLGFTLSHERQGFAWLPLEVLWRQMIQLSVLVSFDASERWIALGVGGAFALTTVACLAARGRPWKADRNDGLLLVAAILLGVYFVMPDRGFAIHLYSERLLLYPLLTLSLWFGAQAPPRLVRNGCVALIVALALAGLGIHVRTYSRLNEHLGEYTSGAASVEPGATILQLNFSHTGRAPDGRPLSLRVSPFLHAAGYLAAARQAVNLKNYEAFTGWFPLRHRPERDPFRHIGKMGGLPPDVHFDDYEEQTGGRVDYVLLWEMRPEHFRDARGASIARQLDAGYELVFRSPRTGLMQLYRRKYHEGGE